MKTYCSFKATKKSSAEQKPQSKVISITRVQVKELLVASQEVVSCEPKKYELGVYHIASQWFMSVLQCELGVIKLEIFKAASQPK